MPIKLKGKLGFAFALFIELSVSWAGFKVEKTSINNAHEGPVCVLSQNRLYFTTLPDYQRAHNEIHYLDLKDLTEHQFIHEANMANGMILSRQGEALLVAEQGRKQQQGGISKIDLTTKARTLLVSSFKKIPFNSPNKLIQTSTGLIIFSDPDYGYFQGFKPKPSLKNGLYAYDPLLKQLRSLSYRYKMPHGLALSFDKSILYLSDTAALNGRDPYNPKASHQVFKLRLAQQSIRSSTLFLNVTPGIPDGLLTYKNKSLLVAAGNGLQHFNEQGRLVETIPLEKGAVNLTSCGNNIFVTSPSGLYILRENSA